MTLDKFLGVKCWVQGQELPKLNPDMMAYWRRVGASYEEFGAHFVPSKLAGNMDEDQLLKNSEVSALDFIQVGELLIPAHIFLDELERKGFLKMRSLSKRISTLHL